MSVVRDIVRTYVAPRRVQSRRMAGPPREDRAFAVLVAACLLMFVAQVPLAARLAELDPEVPLQARLGAALFSWLFIMPLAAYGLAAVVYLPFRLAFGTGSWFGARMALFWAMLASAPIWLLNGLVAGFIGPGGALNFTGGLWLLALFGIWGAGLAANLAQERGAA